MTDFTIQIYISLLHHLSDAGYSLIPFSSYLTSKNNLPDKWVILRHDVDRKPENSLAFARIQNEMNICGSYYFRIQGQRQDQGVIREIVSLGHEVGYHYEDVSYIGSRFKMKGNEGEMEKAIVEEAIMSFRENLRKLREIAPVKTICMHGSPLSRWDNRLLWKYYDYRDLGILGEPYFDIDFNEVLYLTDTGRRWDGDKYTVRDRISYENPDRPYEFTNFTGNEKKRYKKTPEIIRDIRTGTLQSKILMTFHPQRWTGRSSEWIKELIVQRAKNLIKRMIILYSK